MTSKPVPWTPESNIYSQTPPIQGRHPHGLCWKWWLTVCYAAQLFIYYPVWEELMIASSHHSSMRSLHKDDLVGPFMDAMIRIPGTQHVKENSLRCTSSWNEHAIWALCCRKTDQQIVDLQASSSSFIYPRLPAPISIFFAAVSTAHCRSWLM